MPGDGLMLPPTIGASIRGDVIRILLFMFRPVRFPMGLFEVPGSIVEPHDARFVPVLVNWLISVG